MRETALSGVQKAIAATAKDASTIRQLILSLRPQFVNRYKAQVKGLIFISATVAAIIKATIALLNDERTRKMIGWALAAVLSPFILIIVLLCSIGTSGAEHNNATVYSSFYGSGYSEKVPLEFRSHVSEMQTAFTLLDTEVASVNEIAEDGNGLDPIRVKAIFYALCFGEDAPSVRAASNFVQCFYLTEERTRIVEIEQEDGTVVEEEEAYTVAVPISLENAYANLSSLLGREITAEDKSNIEHIYSMIAGPHQNKP